MNEENKEQSADETFKEKIEQEKDNIEVTPSSAESDDVSFEETDEDGNAPTGAAAIKKLREKVKRLEKEKQEYLLLSQRSRADYVNFKKEVEEKRSIDRKFAVKNFIEDLLPVLDAYDMAQANKEAWEKVDKNWRVGIEYIFNQFTSILEKEGVTQFGEVGEKFNPNTHESIEIIKVTDPNESDKIVKVLQKGYKMHDTILRPARVHVGHHEE
ncbi:MAG: GrpE protein molecular chaperone GrpE [Candidatus Nomurabacteria bacterium]|nr:GrpE protein molecular chaperone GrpE [Candidatus Nomurabacteria bacterium]